MYTTYFNLRQAPFSIAPDPRYLFMSERHREALAHLLYGVNSGGGFVLLTGEIGAGKTTVCRCFIDQVPANCKLAYIFNPKLTVEELLLSICDEFGLTLAPAGPGPVGVKGYVDAINGYLLASHAQGTNNVLVIDEAQNLSADVLEQLRLLTNLETSERKLLQIILIGQPELRTMLARPELEQLAQRVIARYHLGPLTEGETGEYVAHRLAVAGAMATLPIPRALTPLIYRLTQGVPRRINLLCDRALLGAYAENSPVVTRAILRQSAKEVFVAASAGPAAPKRWPLALGGVLAGVALTAVAWQSLPKTPPLAVPVVAQAPLKPVAQAAPAPLAAPLATVIAGADEAAALGELAGLWDVTLAAGAPCDAVLAVNLRCHQGKGGLYELRLLDRPAVVMLHDGPATRYALLTGLDDAKATLMSGGITQKVAIATLVQQLGGEFTTLYKMPRGFRSQLVAGAQGADVDWIAQRLAQINDEEPPPVERPLGKRTRAMLKAFQMSQNLKSDGVAGPRTYMRLNQLSGVTEPRLLASARTEH
ncbi:ExeA family protein [Massilia sp. S19_KUP03_FR1]|uniref:ExeA family protein n=1 Tax=Massilia sp. S19_KUP03_FR1 TaxID=3025503 RepID=UPI002FCD4692